MPRRLAAALLAVVIALAGLTSVACAAGSCLQVSGVRMKCCAGEGWRSDRACCDTRIAKAAPPAAAAFERAPQAAPPAVLPALPVAALAAPRAPALSVVAPRSLGPPASLLAHHTALLC
ncbi:MAG: hypothetical protein SF182_04300 [Deltaproteobacteria bacterium]|nr:hypothetical protein [Deltaproteobacteria bacterium]